ncbi:hypothetical protein [Burkholderia sp. BCC1993]|uniref:hypothetical protein n=1 Tax=Burkholderia sp. BCC1993 TaxID=2817444 RepID=UPI002AAFC2F0|nr:hypothetical protein [Burkholderia sp. BCC1993]
MPKAYFSKFFKFMLAAVFLIALLAALLIGVMAYIRDDGGDAACPNLSTSQMRAYLSKYAKHNNLSNVTFDEAAEYLVDLQQWKIPYRVDNHRYVAKMTCKGFVVDNVGPFD